MTASDPSGSEARAIAPGSWPAGILPLGLLCLFIAVLVGADPLAALRQGAPPVEELTVERVGLTETPLGMTVTVVNGGREPVTISQVLVDGAYWVFSMDPPGTLEPLSSVILTLAYPWVEGEALEIVLLTSTGATFGHRIDVTTGTPQFDSAVLAALGLIGLYVGVIPIAIGLLWYPFVRRLRPGGIAALLAFTAGILAFLAVDASGEALELARSVPRAFNGLGIFAVTITSAAATLVAVRAWAHGRRGSGSALSLATLIAIGVGLHNFGEGLAIAAAYSVGATALSSRLVIGFALHNSTEGLAIVAPLGDVRPGVGRLAALGVIAGAPAILGSWVGGLAYSPALAVMFLGVGVGAMAQVVWEVLALLRRRYGLDRPSIPIGLGAGAMVMYLSGLIIA